MCNFSSSRDSSRQSVSCANRGVSWPARLHVHREEKSVAREGGGGKKQLSLWVKSENIVFADLTKALQTCIYVTYDQASFFFFMARHCASAGARSDRSANCDKDSAFGFVHVFCVYGLVVGRVRIQTLHMELYLDSHYTINPEDKLGQFVK